MKVSLKWLSEYVDIPSDLSAFCDRLDLTGTGIEGIEVTGQAFENVVTGRIVSKEAHPDSDHLWVTRVDVGNYNLNDDGEPELLQIVCGAQNFEEGDHVVVALVGAVLPGDIKIKKSKLRGVVSFGMNCSERELGLGSNHDGIMILPEDAPVGMPFAEYAELTDTVLDLEITPNRSDCLSVTGIAREVGAMLQVPVRDPLDDMAAQLVVGGAGDGENNQPDDQPDNQQSNQPDNQSGENTAAAVRVTIDDAQRCPRYTARVIRGCRIEPSPSWMVERLASIGQRSINNIVDATNYILFLLGQPLHAFDFDKLADNDGLVHIVVRAAQNNETLTTLDGQKRVLTPDMTVISTPEAGAVALAGVMGGMDTEVTDSTTNILLEAATFEPGRTSRTSRNLGLMSESSIRYERGVDDHDIDKRADAAAALIAEVSGGVVSSIEGCDNGLVDVWPCVSEKVTNIFRTERFCNMMGADIPSDFIVDILTRLGCEVSRTDDPDVLNVVSPTFRPDLEREADLYEEALRLWGMDRIEPTLPASPERVGVRTEAEHIIAKINDTLRACGLNETITYSFADPADIEKLSTQSDGLDTAVTLLNPINADQSVMRQSIVPGLLRSVSHNQNRGVNNIQLYEIGTVFFAVDGSKLSKECQRVAGVLAGSMHDAAWNQPDVTFDFFDGKGVLENIARELALPKVRFRALSEQEAPYLQPGRAAEMVVDGTAVGWVGEIHPLIARDYDVEPPVVAFELDVDALIRERELSRPYVDVSMYPAVTIDQAFVVNEDITHEKMSQVMKSAGGKLLESASLFDVYRDDERVGAGKKSVAYTLVYRAPDRTLTSEEADKAHTRVVKKVCAATGAEVRA